MTDRELLEAAARAAGIAGFYEDNSITHEDADGFTTTWNPLNDDGDALRLAVKLNLYPLFYDDLQTLTLDYQAKPGPFNILCELYAGDKLAATRRAIVRAAAEIGAQMQEVKP